MLVQQSMQANNSCCLVSGKKLLSFCEVLPARNMQFNLCCWHRTSERASLFGRDNIVVCWRCRGRHLSCLKARLLNAGQDDLKSAVF